MPGGIFFTDTHENLLLIDAGDGTVRWTVPPVPELGLSTELTHALERSGSIIRISSQLAYLPEQVDRIIAGLGELPEEFTVAELRDQFGLTRKYAVPLAEWLDAEGYTIRRGDLRSVRSR